MSSLIDASEPLGHETLNGDCDSRIIHFDATQRRKEKMRQRSQDAPQKTEETPEPEAVPEPKPALEEKPLAPPASTKSATLDAYATPPPAQDESPAGASPAQLSGAELEKFLIDFVVEQTGYPPEMVELDADLEADLGIDSIKKAQLFGELAEQFEITVDVTDESLSLDDFPTLGHVTEFLESQSGGSAASKDPAPATKTPASETLATSSPSANGSAAPAANGNGVPQAPAPAAPMAEALAGMDLESFLVDFVVEQTGYPPEMVELDADLEADLGIDSIKKAQLFGELAEQFEITVDVTDESLSLDAFPTLQHVLEFLQSAGSQASAAGPAKEAIPAAEASKIQERQAAPNSPATGLPQTASNGAPANGAAAKAQPEAARSSESSPAADLGQEEMETFLVNFVVEQTGYPPEMVELDADLEADLGIDSIKKAQMMGELAEQFAITVDVTDENLTLDDFPTLRHVCEFLAAPGKVSA